MNVVLLSRVQTLTIDLESKKRSFMRSYTTDDGRSDSDSGRTDFSGQSSYDDNKKCSIRYEIIPDETNDSITRFI